MMRPDAKVQKVYLYPKPVDFRKPINGLAALVDCGFHAIRPPSPLSSGQAFHGHPAGQSERSDAGVALLV